MLRILVYAGFVAALISTVREPSIPMVITTVVLGIATAVIGLRHFLEETFRSG